jgi:hypothetical protein
MSYKLQGKYIWERHPLSNERDTSAWPGLAVFPEIPKFGKKAKKGAFPPTVNEEGEWVLVSLSDGCNKTESSDLHVAAEAYKESMTMLAGAIQNSKGDNAEYSSAIFYAKSGNKTCDVNITDLGPPGLGMVSKSFKDLFKELRSTSQGRSLCKCTDEDLAGLKNGTVRAIFDVFTTKLLLDELDKRNLFDFVKSYGRQAKQSGRAYGKILFELTYEQVWNSDDEGVDAFANY